MVLCENVSGSALKTKDRLECGGALIKLKVTIVYFYSPQRGGFITDGKSVLLSEVLSAERNKPAFSVQQCCVPSLKVDSL